MNDQRIGYLRDVLTALLDSLEAVTRLARWHGSEPAPEPLRESASKLVERFGTANRLAAGKFTGPPRIVETMNRVSSGIQQLDMAYVRYRQRAEAAPAERAEATAALEAEIEDVKTFARSL